MSRFRSVGVVIPYLTQYREPFFAQLNETLRKENIKLRVYSGHPLGPAQVRSDQSSGYPTIELKQWTLNLKGRVLSYRALPSGWSSMDLMVFEHATRNLETYLALVVRKFLGKKNGLWGHGHTITEPQPKVNFLLQKLMVRLCDVYFAYTPASGRRATALGLPAGRVKVVFNTFETRDLLAAIARREQGIEKENSDWNALYIGAIDSSKRLDFLIQVAQEVRRIRDNFCLLIAGEGDWGNLNIPSDLHGKVKTFGRADDELKSRLGAAAKILLMPGRVGLVVIDSFALGLPVVTTNWPYHAPEFEYLDTKNSVVCGDNVKEVASSIVNLMDNEKLRLRLVAAARESLSKYPLEVMVDLFSEGIIQTLEPNIAKVHD